MRFVNTVMRGLWLSLVGWCVSDCPSVSRRFFLINVGSMTVEASYKVTHNWVSVIRSQGSRFCFVGYFFHRVTMWVGGRWKIFTFPEIVDWPAIFFNQRPCIRYKKCKPNNPSEWWNPYLWDKKHAFTRVSFKYNRGDCSGRDSRWNTAGAKKWSTFMGVGNKTSQYDWTNEFYLFEYFGTSHSRPFQVTRVQLFFLNRGSLMWASWWSVEYGW